MVGYENDDDSKAKAQTAPATVVVGTTAEQRRERLRRLHTAVLEKDAARLQQLLSASAQGSNGENNQDSNSALHLLWEPIRARRTCLHVAARSFLLEQYQPGSSSTTTCSSSSHHNNNSSSETPALDLWKWILKRAAVTANNDNNNTGNKFLTARDKSGESCVDIFLASWLAPPIGMSQSHVLRTFEESLTKVLAEPASLDALRSWIETQLHHNGGEEHQDPLAALTREPPHLAIVGRFWRALELLCRAAAVATAGSSGEGQQMLQVMDDWSIPCPVVPFLARMGSCPEPIARLALSLFPEQARTMTSSGTSSGSCCLPLHLWAQSPNPSDPDRDGLVAVLVQAYPQAVTTVEDHQQRLPLHLALESGKPLQQLHHLWTHHPAVLSIPDPVTNLYGFTLTALALRKEQRSVARAVEKRSPSTSLHEWLTECNNRERDVLFEDPRAVARLNVLYQVVRAHPAALLRSNFPRFRADRKKKSASSSKLSPHYR